MPYIRFRGKESIVDQPTLDALEILALAIEYLMESNRPEDSFAIHVLLGYQKHLFGG